MKDYASGKPASLAPEAELVFSGRLVGDARRGPDAVKHADLELPVSLNDEAWKLVSFFEVPAAPRAAAAAAGVPPRDLPLFYRQVEHLARTGILVPPDEEEHLFRSGRILVESGRRLLRPVDHGLFGGFTALRPADFDVVGVPFDRASTRPGSAAAPGVLRALTGAPPFFSAPRAGCFRGVRDSSDGKLLLQGATFCDFGDVDISRADGWGSAFDRIASAARHVARVGAGVPVFLGGGHSVTEPILRGLPAERVFVVQLDAHTDLGPCFSGAPHNHGSVMARVIRLPQVEGLLQIGVRDPTPPWWVPPPGVRQMGARVVRHASIDEILAGVPAEIPCYLTIDIDVLDPSVAPATGTPIPGGLGLLEVEDLLAALGSERAVIGIDLVEYAPSLAPGPVTAISVLRILLRLLEAIRARTSTADAE